MFLGSVNAIKERGGLAEDAAEVRPAALASLQGHLTSLQDPLAFAQAAVCRWHSRLTGSNNSRLQVCVAMAMRRRAANAPDDSLHFADRFYRELKTRLTPLDKQSAAYTLISKMLATGSPQLKLDGILSVERAGENGRFAAFTRLPNRMLLWRGMRSTSVPSVLFQGFKVPSAEAPALMHMFGKGLYFSACASEASKACCLSERNASGVMAVCEVALGERHAATRPSFMRRAPHGTHSVVGR